MPSTVRDVESSTPITRPERSPRARLARDARKAAHPRVVHKGIRLKSRSRVQREFDVMARMVDQLPEPLARRIASIWCDSSCCAHYLINIRPDLHTPELEVAIPDAFLAADGWHNGICLKYPDGTVLATIDPDCGEDWEEDDRGLVEELMDLVSCLEAAARTGEWRLSPLGNSYRVATTGNVSIVGFPQDPERIVNYIAVQIGQEKVFTAWVSKGALDRIVSWKRGEWEAEVRDLFSA